MIEVVMRGGSSGREGYDGGRGREGVRDQGVVVEGWKGEVGVKVVEGDHTEHVQMSQRSSRHDG